MKRIKRIVSILLLFVILITSSGMITACSISESQKVKMGEWLAMINSSFGMESYLSETPYFSDITSDNPYFGSVQIAVEWNVINPDEELNLEKNVTWKEVLVTLVNVGAFLSDDATEDDKVAYGIKYFDDTIQEKTLNKEIDISDATELLTAAQKKWANLTFDEAIEIVEYAKGVLDYSQGENAIADYQIDERGNLILSAEDASRISEGDIFVLAANEYTMGTVAYKATAIETDGDNVKISVDSDIPLEEVVDEMYIAETLIPTSENTVIRDGNGNIIHAGVDAALGHSKEYSGGIANLAYAYGEYNTVKNVSSASTTTSFEVDGYKVSLKYKLDGDLDLEASVETDNLLNVPKTSSKKLTGKVALSVSNLSVTPVFNFSWGELKEASVRVNYKEKHTFSLTYKDDIKDVVLAPYNNGNGKYLTNVLKAKLKDKNAEGNGAKTIKICSIDVYSIGVARLCLDVNLKISAEGSVSITITESSTKGIEYKNGNLRVISDSDKDSQVDIKGKIEGTINVGPALYAVGLKKCLIGFSASGGVGANAALTMKLADNENHLLETADASDIMPETMENIDIQITASSQAIEEAAAAMGCVYKPVAEEIPLHVDKCLDVSVYGILRIELSDSYCKDLTADKIKISWEIFGEKNAKFAHIHIDNFNTINMALGEEAGETLCTLKYNPFEEDTEEAEELVTSTEEFTGVAGETLILSEMNVAVEIGEVYTIVIEQMPEGYNESDIIISSSDTNVVVVNSDGTVSALNSGSAVITVSTSDGEYSAFCAITVLVPQEIKTI